MAMLILAFTFLLLKNAFGVEILTIVTQNPTECQLKFCYYFKGINCDISYLIIDQTNFENALTSKSILSYYQGLENCNNKFGNIFDSPITYNINTSDFACKKESEICFTVYNKDFGTVPLVLKEGNNCNLYYAPGPIENPNYNYCLDNSQCDIGDPEIDAICTPCGECQSTIYDTVLKSKRQLTNLKSETEFEAEIESDSCEEQLKATRLRYGLGFGLGFGIPLLIAIIIGIISMVGCAKFLDDFMC